MLVGFRNSSNASVDTRENDKMINGLDIPKFDDEVTDHQIQYPEIQ
jgi:hypothetical protein